MKGLQSRLEKNDCIYVLIIVVIAFFVSLQNVCSPISTRINYSDGSIYQYIGHLICIGKMPYIDAFDHKGPILYLLNAFSLLFGHNGVWAIDLTCMILYAIITYFIAKRYVNLHWALIVTIVSVTALSNSYWIGNTPDWYASVATLYCVFLFAEYYNDNYLSNIKILFIGIAIAFCFWQKFTTIGIIGILCIGILFLDFKKTNSIKFGTKCIICSLFGFSIVTIPLLLWLWKKNAIRAMLTDYFLFSTSYGTSHVTMQEKIEALKYFFTDPFIAISAIMALCFTFSIWVLNHVDTTFEATGSYFSRKFSTDFSAVIICGSALICQAMVNALAGRKYIQYKLILYPCAFLIICIFLKFTLDISKKSHIKRIIIALLGTIILFNLSNSIKNQERLNDVNSVIEVAEIRKYVSSGDVIAIASPDDCGLYLNTDTESATQYPYIQADLYGDDNFWQTYNEQLLQSDAAVIVWNNNWDANLHLSMDVLSKYNRIDLDRLVIFERKD